MFRIISIDQKCKYDLDIQIKDKTNEYIFKNESGNIIEPKIYKYNFLTDNLYFMYISNIKFLKKDILFKIKDGKISIGDAYLSFNMKKDISRTKYISIEKVPVNSNSIVSFDKFDIINRNKEYIIKIGSSGEINKCLGVNYYLAVRDMKLEAVSLLNDDTAFSTDSCIFYINDIEDKSIVEKFYDLPSDYTRNRNILITLTILVIYWLVLVFVMINCSKKI